MMMMRKVLKKKKKTSLVLICIILLFWNVFLRCFSFTPLLLLSLLLVFNSRGSPKENISHKVLFY